MDKEVTQEISLVHSKVSVSNPYEFKRALERVEILISQPMLNLIEGYANLSPNITVDEARRQIPKTNRLIVLEVSKFNCDQMIYDCQANIL